MKRRAFTLVEIMIVVAIIGILLSIAIPNWISARENSRQKTCLSNLNEINNAKEEWATASGASDAATPTTADLVPDYMHTFPQCPTSGTYSINSIQQNATCSYTTGAWPHVLPN